MYPTLPARPRSHANRVRCMLALSLALACVSGLGLAGVAHADVAAFAPTFTAGQPVSRTDFPYQSFVPGHLSAVPDPNGSGVAVLKYAVDNSDQPYPGANPRADLLTRPWYTEGSTLFTSIPVKIPAGLSPFQNNGSSYYQFAEAKDTAASFPSWGLGLMADSAGRNHWFFGSTTEIGTFGDLWLGPVVDGGWHTFVVAAYYTAATRKGWLELYMDGQPVKFNMGKFSGQTRATGITTILDHVAAWPLDINSYRSSGSLAGTMTMYHGAPKIGTTLASVIGSPAPLPAPVPAPVEAPAPSPVSVLASPRPLKAAFTSSRHTSPVGQTVTFDATISTGGPVSYAWSLGRHALGTGPTLTYTFRSAGTKHVRLTITAADGATSTVSHKHLVLRKHHRSTNRRARRSHPRVHHHRRRHVHHRAHHRHHRHRAHHGRRHRHHHRAHHRHDRHRAHHGRQHRHHHRAHHGRNRHHHRRAGG